jgi:hypothetical protein
LNLNQREHCPGLSYVAVSRVKTLSGVLFKVPFDFDRFKPVNSAVSVDREIVLHSTYNTASRAYKIGVQGGFIVVFSGRKFCDHWNTLSTGPLAYISCDR